MSLDIIDLRDFYNRPIGHVVRRVLRIKLHAHWRETAGLRILGFGYAVPYLGAFADQAERICAFMPSGQGVIAWPPEGPSRTALVESGMWPLPDSMMDRILLVHALEISDGVSDLLREAWRCLAPGGKLLAIVPNRRGVWSRTEHTPFGHGRPYSKSQLTQLLRAHAFTPEAWSEALMFPPLEGGLMLRSSVGVERLGTRFWPLFAGVHIVEASKQVYRPVAVRQLKRLSMGATVPVLAPAGSPVPASFRGKTA
jgi:SAM-dependent methyltransferase